MFKKKGRLEEHVVNSALTNTLLSLSEAQKIATKREDLEGLIVVAERWLLMAEKIKGLDESRPVMLGFTSGMPEEYEDEPEENLEEHDGEIDQH